MCATSRVPHGQVAAAVPPLDALGVLKDQLASLRAAQRSRTAAILRARAATAVDEAQRRVSPCHNAAEACFAMSPEWPVSN